MNIWHYIVLSFAILLGLSSCNSQELSSPNARSGSTASSDDETAAPPENLTGAYLHASLAEDITRSSDGSFSGQVTVSLLHPNGQKASFSSKDAKWLAQLPPYSKVSVQTIDAQDGDSHAIYTFTSTEEKEVRRALREANFHLEVKSLGLANQFDSPLDQNTVLQMNHGYGLGMVPCTSKTKFPNFVENTNGQTMAIGFNNLTDPGVLNKGNFVIYRRYGNGQLEEIQSIDRRVDPGVNLFTTITLEQGALYQINDGNTCHSLFGVPTFEPGDPMPRLAAKTLPMSTPINTDGCDRLDRLFSPNSDTEITFIIDVSAIPGAKFYWYNFDGQPELFADGIPRFSQTSYVPHPWEIRGPNGECLAAFSVDASMEGETFVIPAL